MRGCEVVWAIKNKSIGQTFFDEGAATFFLPHLSTPHPAESATASGQDGLLVVTKGVEPIKRPRYTHDDPLGMNDPTLKAAKAFVFCS